MISAPIRATFDTVRVSRLIVLMLALLPLALALLAPATYLAPPPVAPLARAQVPSLYRTVADLPLPLQYTISRDLGRDDPSYYLASAGDGIRAANAAQGLSAVLGGAGLRVASHGETWSLALAGWGQGDSLTPFVPTAAPRIHANGMQIDYGALTAWYANGPLGLQQGWTIAAPPNTAARMLTLAFDQSGTLHGTVAPDGSALLLRDATGAVRLCYTGLLAYDANGRELPARLEVKGARLRVRVDTASAAYPLTIDPWVQTALLTDANATNPDSWGYVVAVNGDGSTIVVGDPFYHPSGSRGYVYMRSGISWTNAVQVAKLTASDSTEYDRFGASVAVSLDGATIALGATDRNAAYVYVRPQSGWADMTQTAELTIDDNLSPYSSGAVAAMSGDSNTIVLSSHGAAYVYVRPPSGWTDATQVAKLTASDDTSATGLGGAVVSADGGTVLLRASGPIYGSSVPGKAYVYMRPQNGWANATQTARLTGSDAVVGDALSYGAAISADGSTILLGAPRQAAGGSDRGAGYIYVRPQNGWADATQTAKLTASDGADGDNLGYAVAMSADGLTMLLGAPNQDAGGIDRGAGYVFVRPPTGWKNITQADKLMANDGVNSDHLGLGSALSADGNTIVLSAPTPNINGATGRAAYVFEQPWQITSAAPAAGVVGVPYSFTFTTNVATPHTWSVSAGALPPGLALGASSGILSGMPTLTGNYSFTVHVGGGNGTSATRAVMLLVGQAPAISSGAPPAGVVGQAYSFTFTASGTPAPTWSISAGTLQPGLALGARTGILNGTHTAPGTYTFTVRAGNGVGAPATRQVTLTAVMRLGLPMILHHASRAYRLGADNRISTQYSSVTKKRSF